MKGKEIFAVHTVQLIYCIKHDIGLFTSLVKSMEMIMYHILVLGMKDTLSEGDLISPILCDNVS